MWQKKLFKIPVLVKSPFGSGSTAGDILSCVVLLVQRNNALIKRVWFILLLCVCVYTVYN